jgi:hypothetical protein
VPPGTADDAAVVPSTESSAAAAAAGTPAEAAAEAAQKADASTSRRVLVADDDDDDDDEFHAEQNPHVETIATIMAKAVTTTDAPPQKAVAVRRFVVRGALAGVVRRGFKGVVEGTIVISCNDNVSKGPS